MLGDLWSYKDLVKPFVRREFVSVYKQTNLWQLWYLIEPFVGVWEELRLLWGQVLCRTEMGKNVSIS
jgi:ABC-type polysaccharide/polyol phosphate export permease